MDTLEQQDYREAWETWHRFGPHVSGNEHVLVCIIAALIGKARRAAEKPEGVTA